MGALESLPSSQGAAPPDLRDAVCRHRAKATQEFMAEVENMTIPISAAPTGNPVLDALAGGRQSVSVRDLARLPRPFFTPVVVYAGRAPGYQGPVARARPAGVPIGVAEATAYTGEKSEGAEASPISNPAPDAKPLRGAAGDKHAKAPPPPKPEASETPPPAKSHVVKAAHVKAAHAKGKAKAAALETKKPQKKTEAKAHKEHAAAHPVQKGKAVSKHAEKPQKGKAHAAKTSDAGGAGAGDAGQ
jgi:D-alanyl-D-alanine carboxypeptidase